MRSTIRHALVLLVFLRVAPGIVHGDEPPRATTSDEQAGSTAPDQPPSATAPDQPPNATTPAPDANETPPPPDSLAATPPELPSAKAPAKELPHHPAAANPPHHKSEISDETFKFRASVDLPIGLGAATTWVLLAALQNQLASSCRWCDRSASGGDGLNAFDRAARHAFKWSDISAANTISDVTAFVALPLFVAGMDLASAGSPRRWSRWAMDILIIAEAATLSGALTSIVKYSASRQRPYVHYELLSGVSHKTSVDDNASFFSGHTSFAFSVATAAGTVASLRHYKWAPLIWSVGMTVATFTGYLRIAADQHYLSDVIVGGLVGSAFGVGIPLLRWIRPLRERKISFSGQGGSNGALLAISGVW